MKLKRVNEPPLVHQSLPMRERGLKRRLDESLFVLRNVTPPSDIPENKSTGFAAFDYYLHEWGGVTAFFVDRPEKIDYPDKLINGVKFHAR